jgi:hypothetical protein
MSDEQELFGVRNFVTGNLVQVSHPNVDPVPGVTVECSRISDSGKVVTKCRVYNPQGYWENSKYCDNRHISKLCYKSCKDDLLYRTPLSILSEGIKDGFDGLGWDLDHYWVNETPENLLLFRNVDLFEEPSHEQLSVFAKTVKRIVVSHPELPRLTPNKALIFAVWARLLHPFNMIFLAYGRWLYRAYRLGLVDLYFDADAKLDPDPLNYNGHVLEEKDYAFLQMSETRKFNCIQVLGLC